ncbi:MAG: cation:proton antiporter [Planctomycetota bacterium]
MWENLNIILLIGIAIFGGSFGARVFQKIRIPQVVGYVIIGILLGPVLNIISQQTIKGLEIFNVFALGIIGFLVGGELKREIFVKFGRQVPIILFFEGIGAFLLVGILTFLVMWYFSGWQTALAVAVVFGAICSATDPASTIAVLWEYKARGPLTSMVTAIVTLDDALALILYTLSVGIAAVITGHQESGINQMILRAVYEMAGSVIVGLVVGIVLNWVLRKVTNSDNLLAFATSATLLFIGFARYLRLDVILTSMAVGLVLTNIESRKNAATFELMHKFSGPIYVLFFVLVGARLEFHAVNRMIWLLVAAYVVGSMVGKTSGAYLGSVYARSVTSMRKYLGFCLYPQGGIAIGLLMMASSRFESNVSSIMLLVVIIGAFVLQVIGPIGVKIAAVKAGEAGLNVTEEDLVEAYKVRNVMDTEVPTLRPQMVLSEVIKTVSLTNYYYYPVIDDSGNLLGAITLDNMRNTFAVQELNNWLVALDIMLPVAATTTSDTSLAGAMDKMKKMGITYMPVVVSQDNRKYLGLLGSDEVQRKLSGEVLARQKEASDAHSATAVRG